MVKIHQVSHNWCEIPGGLTWLFVGQPKTGKTTSASKWSEKGTEGVLILDTDHGADFVKDANVISISHLNTPIRQLKDKAGNVLVKQGNIVTEVIPPEERGYYWRTGSDKGKPMATYALDEAYEYIANNWDELPYDTIVIDTIDQINEWIEQSVVEDLQIGSMGEGQWGADWGRARKRNMNLIKKFEQLIKKKGGTLILIAHAKPTVITDGKTQLSPELPRGLSRAVTAKADIIGYITGDKKTEEYYISFVSYDERMIGSRLKPLAQKRLLFDYEVIKQEITQYKEK